MVEYKVEKESINSEIVSVCRIGEVICFKRGANKNITLTGGICRVDGYYDDVDDLLDDLSVIARVNAEQTED